MGGEVFGFWGYCCCYLLYLPFAVGNRVVSDAYKMRAFLCDTRTWGRGSAPLEEGRMIRLRLVAAVVLLTFFNFSTTFQSPCSRKRHGFIILPLTLEKRVRASRCSAYLVRFPKINTFCDGKRKLVIFSKVPIDQRSMWIIVCAISGLAY